MNKMVMLIHAMLFSVILALPAAASDHRSRYGGNQGYHPPPYSDPNHYSRPPGRGYEPKHGKREDRPPHGRRYEYPRHAHPYQGYRSHPHGRYYDHPYRHRNRDYHYEGHWTSWNDWERYRARFPHRFYDGKYYRDDNGYLFFRFCDPDSNACLFYSIGR